MVLVDVLHVGGGLVGGVVVLASHVGVGSVALRTIDVLVSFQDGFLLLIIVTATEIVVVVVGRVVEDAVKHLWGDFPLYGGEEFLIGLEGLLLLVGQSVVSHILQGS